MSCKLPQYALIAFASFFLGSVTQAYCRKMGYLDEYTTKKEESKGDVTESDKPQSERLYEQDRLLNEYLLLHYGETITGKFCKKDHDENEHSLDIDTEENYGDFSTFNLSTETLEAPLFPSYALDFPTRVAKIAAYFASTGDNKSVLEVGCSVGRTSFELSPYFGKVVGIDFSQSFIDAANRLKAGEKLPFTAPIEGSVSFDAVAAIGSHVRPDVVSFHQGDATMLDSRIKYDCVVAANLIDRIPSPRAFLDSLKHITNQGGYVILTSPYTWLKEFTPKSEWLVADDESSGTKSTFVALKEILEQNGDFSLVHNSHMPFCIRETARKNQFTYAHLTVWKRS